MFATFPLKEIEVLCNFEETSYRCVIENQKVLQDFVLHFIGSHQPYKTNYDVTDIEFSNCIIPKVPQGLTKLFPNLTSLSILNSDLKSIRKADLIEYKHFSAFYFNGNKIESLPGNLFEGFKSLVEVSFENNMLRTIEPCCFDGLDNLSYIALARNVENFRGFDPENEYNNFSFTTFRDFRDHLVGIFSNGMKIKDIHVKFTTENLNVDLLEVQDQIQSADTVKKLMDKQRVTENYNKSMQNFFKNDESLKDLTIKVQNREFRVHKTLMAARSPFIARILEENPQAQCVTFGDMSVDIFEIILKYIYADEFPCDQMDCDEAYQMVRKQIDYVLLFAAAGRLNIDDLKDFAAAKIIEKNLFENPREILDFGLEYEHPELTKKACDIINKMNVQ